MTDKIVVLVTTGNRREARKIARALVEQNLAACVNVSSAIESVYRWQGKLNKEKEYLLFIKTMRELFPEVRAAIQKLHSYTTPEIICLPIVDGLPDYLAWLEKSVKHPGEPQIV